MNKKKEYINTATELLLKFYSGDHKVITEIIYAEYEKDYKIIYNHLQLLKNTINEIENNLKKEENI